MNVCHNKVWMVLVASAQPRQARERLRTTALRVTLAGRRWTHHTGSRKYRIGWCTAGERSVGSNRWSALAGAGWVVLVRACVSAALISVRSVYGRVSGTYHSQQHPAIRWRSDERGGGKNGEGHLGRTLGHGRAGKAKQESHTGRKVIRRDRGREKCGWRGQGGHCGEQEGDMTLTTEGLGLASGRVDSVLGGWLSGKEAESSTICAALHSGELWRPHHPSALRLPLPTIESEAFLTSKLSRTSSCNKWQIYRDIPYQYYLPSSILGSTAILASEAQDLLERRTASADLGADRSALVLLRQPIVPLSRRSPSILGDPPSGDLCPAPSDLLDHPEHKRGPTPGSPQVTSWGGVRHTGATSVQAPQISLSAGRCMISIRSNAARMRPGSHRPAPLRLAPAQGRRDCRWVSEAQAISGTGWAQAQGALVGRGRHTSSLLTEVNVPQRPCLAPQGRPSATLQLELNRADQGRQLGR